MRTFLLRRLVYLPVSLFLLSLACFGLTRITPGDPVLNFVTVDRVTAGAGGTGAYDRAYERVARRLGYDRPAFYWTLTNQATPDTLYRILREDHRRGLRTLIATYGNWPAVQTYYRAVGAAATRTPVGAREESIATLGRLAIQDDATRIDQLVDQLRPDTALTGVVTTYDALVAGADRRALLLPRLRWNGTHNQYHHWMAGVVRGDFGTSIIDRRPVGEKIAAALKWTALLNFLALLLVYLIALPVGMYAAAGRGGWFDRLSSTGLFLLFGIPSFWTATLVANFFTTPAFGMDFFPSMGLGEVAPSAGWWEVVRVRAAHLFLPVMCLAYPSWAYVSRHLRRSALAELRLDYVRTARIKGVSESRVLWGHVFRNASFPIITMLGNLLPGLLAGSVLIERIFNLPGMGQLLLTAALTRDWPLITAIVLLSGLLTAVGLLLADLGYALADPRVRPTTPTPSRQ